MSGKNKIFSPLVSIIIPVYNGAKFINEAIDSALAQTYKNIEIIIVNDGSVDETEHIVKSYGEKVKYIKKANVGVASALNLGIKNSKGQFISWLSHDDKYFPNKIETQVKELQKLPLKDNQKTILYSNYELINQLGDFISRTYYNHYHPSDKLNNALYPLFTGLVNGCTLLIPKNCFIKNGMFDERYPATQDYRLWFKMFPRFTLKFLPQTLVYSRIHEQQGSKLIATKNECSELWIHMIKNTSESDKCYIAGSLEEFYLQTNFVVLNAGYSKAATYISDTYQSLFHRNITRNYLPVFQKEQNKPSNKLRMKLLNKFFSMRINIGI